MSHVPFVVGQWVRGETFYGRGELIEQVLGGERDRLWLLGRRRIGKTSLLKQLELLAADGAYFPLFWDLQGAAAEPDGLHGQFVEALVDVEDRLAVLGIRAGEVKGEDLAGSLERLVVRLRASGKKLLLLCDEVEELIHLQGSDSQWPAVRGSGDGMRTVLASSIRLQTAEVAAGLLQEFGPPRYVNGLDEQASRALLRQEGLPSAARPDFEDHAIETMLAQCGGHPFLMQLLGRRCIDHGDLEEAIEQVAADPLVHSLFALDFGMLSEQERAAVRRIAQGGTSLAASILEELALDERSVERLQGLGYLRGGAGGGRVEVGKLLLRAWLSSDSASWTA